MHIFVIDLDADDRAVVLEEQPGHLLADLRIQPFCIKKKSLAQLPHLKGLSVHPVRYAAVAHLSMVKRAYPQDHIQPVLVAQFNKFAQIPAPRKVKDSFLLLVMNPEKVSGNHADASHLHLDHLVLPACVRHTAEMKFPAHPKEGLPILHHVIVGERDFLPSCACPLKVFAQGADFLFFQIFQIEFISHFVPLFFPAFCTFQVCDFGFTIPQTMPERIAYICSMIYLFCSFRFCPVAPFPD